MRGFDDREKGFEAEFSRQQEFTFRATARRNKLFGLWVADRLRLSGDEAAAYARSVVAADFERPGDSDVIDKVRGDLADTGIKMTDAQLQAELDRWAAAARRQLMEA